MRYAIAIASGLILTCAFPKMNMPGLAWVAPGLLGFSALGTSGRRAFWLGFFGGLAHFLTSLSWLLNIPYTWHGIPLGPGAAWLALGAYCALFPATWVWLCWKILRRSSPGARDEETLTFRTFALLPWTKRALWCLACAVTWTGIEMFRGWFLSGFPWNFLGASQFKMLPLIQIASITGVYGVSFLIVWLSVGLVSGAISLFNKPQSKLAIWSEVALPALAVAGAVLFGSGKIRSDVAPDRMVKLALIQPSIPQTVIWDAAGDAPRFQKVLSLSGQSLAAKPDIIIWPESALPAWTSETASAIAGLATSNNVSIILCGDDVEQGTPPKYYNAAFLLSPEGVVKEVYRKRRLVIFGEYVPLSNWLPFLKWLTPIEGQFTPGIRPVQFHIEKPDVKTSVLICFEDMFPTEARQHVVNDTDFLVNLTNDGWFGHAAEQWQQAIGGVFRAVENGVPLVRCTNDGLTCWIDSDGRIRETFRDAESKIYGEGYLVTEIPVHQKHEQTVYNRYGDVFGWTCFGITALLACNYSRRLFTPCNRSSIAS
ncbi:MAG: apolipoprotein N-acyltransferase [Limisphaerales bacterium]